MKQSTWLFWLIGCLLVLLCVSVSEAQYKFRRPVPPPLPPPPVIYKKSWAPGGRIPPMGNSIHHLGPNFPPKRPMFKPPNYRFRRPPTIPGPLPPSSALFNVLPGSSFKNPISPMNILGNYGTLGQPQPQQLPILQQSQRLPIVKEHQQSSIGKLPKLQFSQEYRPAVEPSISISGVNHRGGLNDDDKGPIHTIPAPNLGPASKSYQQQQQQKQQQMSKAEEEPPRRPYTVTQVDYASIFGQESSVPPQRVSPSNPLPTISIQQQQQQQHHYEVTESNEVNSVSPAYFTPDFDSAQFASSIVEEQQANDVYPSHSSSLSSRIAQQQQQQQQQLDQQQRADVATTSIVSGPVSMQTNLQSTMHVAGSGQQTHYQTDSQSGDSSSPINSAKLYEILNAYPQQLTEQYALNQAPQIQQQLLQQQILQMLQKQDGDQGSLMKTSFSQPTFHSFNYDEQANKQSKQQQQQQQKIFIDQNYASGKVTADYSLAPETSESVQNFNVGDGNEQQENNIEFENPVGHVKPATYFTKIGDEQPNVATQFYTTLPNREAAEKLAALAAAGNVNSQLIGQLRKQQQQQADQPMPSNHKEEDQTETGDANQEKYREKLFYRQHKVRDEQARRYEEKEKQNQLTKEDEKRVLRILVPENNSSDKEKEVNHEDYEYENDEAQISREHETSTPEDSEFGSRIVSKNTE